MAAVVGALAGISTLWIHLTTDPLADVHAYYDAGTRLNQGLPLYPADADPNEAEFYRYPPLLAIAFRPLALLPFPAAATIWMAVLIASFIGTLWWIGIRRRKTWLTVGILGLPIAWSVAVGQAQVPVTFLTTLGSPWALALAANMKLFPALVAPGGSAGANGAPWGSSSPGWPASSSSSSSSSRRRPSTFSALSRPSRWAR